MEQMSPQIMHRLVFTVLMQHLPEAQSGPALQLLNDALSHNQTQIRELAVVAIAELPTPPARRVSALTTALRDPSARVRRRAARAIGDQGAMAAQGALGHLLVGLKDPDASVRRDCAGAVGRIGPPAHGAVPLLIPMLADPETRTRAVVAVAIKRVGKGAVPALLSGLANKNPEQRGRCVTLLAQIAPDDEKVQLALKSMTGDSHPDVQFRIDEAMMATMTPPPLEMPNRMAAAAAIA